MQRIVSEEEWDRQWQDGFIEGCIKQEKNFMTLEERDKFFHGLFRILSDSKVTYKPHHIESLAASVMDLIRDHLPVPSDHQHAPSDQS
jgi:hypothetical protein